MGVHNIKLESEVFQTVPQFQLQGWTPVETKPDYGGILQQLVSQLAQVNVSLNQMHQSLAAQGLALQSRQWQFPNRTPVETKIDPTLDLTREGLQWQFPNRTPVETKVDVTSLQQIVAQVAHLQDVIGQINQGLGGQAFTRAAGGAVEGRNVVEKLRKLKQRKGKEAGAKAT